jgi:hypothetical protein
MKNLLKTLPFLVLLLAAAPPASAQVSFQVNIGPPPAWRPSRIGPQPGPDYTWIDGYWYPVGRRWVWHAGYWTRPPYPGAYWIQPYHDGRQFVPGYWENERGRWDHDHRWDKRRERDEHREGRGRGR